MFYCFMNLVMVFEEVFVMFWFCCSGSKFMFINLMFYFIIVINMKVGNSNFLNIMVLLKGEVLVDIMYVVIGDISF